ncbi:hypothetical protein B0H11DRAFT_2405610 [Mycena galericulata]|nr:hypothetical protein B0H11DRAFT_2405610 [Mycena galericulata]
MLASLRLYVLHICLIIADLVLSKVATHYELNKPGVTPSQIRSVVKQLLFNQCFILPHAATPIPRADDASSPATVANPAIDPATVTNPANARADVAPDPVTVTNPAKASKVILTKARLLFAPALVDFIHETWWSGPKALGFQHLKKLKLNRDDRPTEVVLPDAMICLAGANVWAAILSYQTGYYVRPPEFNQARLEGTYKSLLDIMQKQRDGLSAETFNRVMHDLYLKVSQSPATDAAAASGSANNVICLDIDSD